MSKEFDKTVMFENISFLLRERGKKIGEIESAAGVSAGYISRANKDGGTKPGIDFVVNVAKALNTSVDTLINVRLADLTPTERYLISFLEKLKADTISDKLTWKAESAHILNQMEPGYNGYVDHPLFSFETFYEESECEHPNQVQRVVFVSHSFGYTTQIAGDCYFLRMKNGVQLYLMNVEKSVHKINDPNAYAIEVWMVAPHESAQFLCGTLNDVVLGENTKDLYDAVHEFSKHPKVNGAFQYVINAFMNNDDLSDDPNGDLPF